MGLTLQASTGITRPLAIVDKFKVDVRHKTRAEYDRIEANCAGKDPEEQAKVRAEAFLAGWSGCTPVALRKIGVPVTDAQPVDSQGCVPFDADCARDVWKHALDGLFAGKILLFSLRMLEAVEAEKDLAKNDSGGSFPISITP